MRIVIQPAARHETVQIGREFFKLKARDDEKKEGEKVLRSERYFGAVARSFQLPMELDVAQAKARCDNGVLTLTLPKKQETSAQRLAIEEVFAIERGAFSAAHQALKALLLVISIRQP